MRSYIFSNSRAKSSNPAVADYLSILSTEFSKYFDRSWNLRI